MTLDERNITYSHLIVQRLRVLDVLDRRDWLWDDEISLMLDRLDAMLMQGRGASS